MTQEFGQRILQLLKDKGWSQKDFAGRVGLTETAVSRYINGEREPKPDVIANMATCLHTSSDYLLGRYSSDGDEPFDFFKTRRMLARNAGELTSQERDALISAMFGKE